MKPSMLATLLSAMLPPEEVEKAFQEFQTVSPPLTPEDHLVDGLIKDLFGIGVPTSQGKSAAFLKDAMKGFPPGFAQFNLGGTVTGRHKMRVEDRVETSFDSDIYSQLFGGALPVLCEKGHNELFKIVNGTLKRQSAMVNYSSPKDMVAAFVTWAKQNCPALVETDRVLYGMSPLERTNHYIAQLHKKAPAVMAEVTGDKQALDMLVMDEHEEMTRQRPAMIVEALYAFADIPAEERQGTVKGVPGYMCLEAFLVHSKLAGTPPKWFKPHHYGKAFSVLFSACECGKETCKNKGTTFFENTKTTVAPLFSDVAVKASGTDEQRRPLSGV